MGNMKGLLSMGDTQMMWPLGEREEEKSDKKFTVYKDYLRKLLFFKSTIARRGQLQVVYLSLGRSDQNYRHTC